MYAHIRFVSIFQQSRPMNVINDAFRVRTKYALTVRNISHCAEDADRGDSMWAQHCLHMPAAVITYQNKHEEHDHDHHDHDRRVVIGIMIVIMMIVIMMMMTMTTTTTMTMTMTMTIMTNSRTCP